ncbi:hypothetical protein [Roseisalinus antarcticus]|uniref:Type II secretion system protein GspC N-terminal domain-containing protein n=1 Tax=Roseisalinus antarcticus TaxID=254357 RepID=A0A1Y5STS5_9RHOB|nr:hypothetical protein [Roseisalinus antarcticus]SLN47922.1 hypothetical protein ROA7023_02046 [Roseisalinus antarcticus]
MDDDSNADTARAATEPQALDLSATALIGLIDGPEGPSALLRYRDGEIATVAPGESTPEGQVVAIDDTRVVIAQRAGQLVLTMPAG